MANDQDKNAQVAGISAPIRKPKGTKKPSKLKRQSTGKRYSPAKRKMILAFVEKKGRGGFVLAHKRWGVSYIALNNWRKQKQGVKKSSILGRPKKDERSRKAIQDIKKFGTLIEGIKKLVSKW